MKQIVEHKKLSTLHGLLLVAGLMIVLILMNYLVLGLLATRIGNGASSIAFWVLGGGVAWIVLQLYVVKYYYLLDDEILQINRAYGKRERHVENVPLHQMVFLGKPEEAQKRYPNARKVRALHLKGENLTVALVHRVSDGHRILLFQPNDEIQAALKAKIKGK